MSAIYISNQEINSLEKQLRVIESQLEVKSLLFLMADGVHCNGELLNPILQGCTKPVIGGVFPELIYNNTRKSEGVLLLPLDFEIRSQLFNLSDSQERMMEQLEDVQQDSLDTPSGLFIFTDALSDNKKSFTESVFNFFGILPSYIGGGAGTLSFIKKPCVINNQGIHQNAAVIAWASKEITVGVAHGWDSISEPLKITEADNRVIKTINWKPAFEVYKSIVERHSGKVFNRDNFFDIAKAYPLGIARMDAEMVVRDPFMVDGDNLHVLDAVEEGEYVKILYGDLNSLLSGAKHARENAFLNSKELFQNKNKDVFCIDCISRVLFMQNSFKKELEVVGKDRIVHGILSIGEIANSDESFLEIFNKTIVVSTW